LNDEATNIMQDLFLRFFENRCFVTREKFQKRGFVIHHLWYIEGDVIRGNYPKGEKGRQDYIKALRPMVEAEPFRFMGLKNGVHTKMDHVRNGITRMKKENQMRLFIACLLTKKTPRKTHKKVKSFTRYKK
jgi:hypothetical protein